MLAPTIVGSLIAVDELLVHPMYQTRRSKQNIAEHLVN